MISNKKLVAVIFCVAILLFVGGYLWWSSMPQGSLLLPKEGKGTLRALLGMDAPIKCTIRQDAERGILEGTSYVAGKRLRADYTTVHNGEKITSGIYTDGVVMYIWSETPQGMMGSTFTLESDAQIDEKETTTSDVPLEEEVHYTCEPWRIDEQVLRPLDGIVYMDMNNMMQGVQQGETWSFDPDTDPIEQFPPAAPSLSDLPGLNCGICDDLPDPGAKAACRESLMCE